MVLVLLNKQSHHEDSDWFFFLFVSDLLPSMCNVGRLSLQRFFDPVFYQIILFKCRYIFKQIFKYVTLKSVGYRGRDANK